MYTSPLIKLSRKIYQKKKIIISNSAAEKKINQSALNLAQREANSYNIDDVALESVSFTTSGVHNTVRWLAVIAIDDTACGRRQPDGDSFISHLCTKKKLFRTFSLKNMKVTKILTIVVGRIVLCNT